MSLRHVSRRRFLAAGATALGFPTFIPGRALGLDGATAPSNRIVLASIGWGMQGPGNTGNFLNESDCQVVALCDLDKKHLEEGRTTINNFYKNDDCKTYSDYRELLARKDIDAVMIAVPDHWHALVATEAARQKKDIYGEKPLAHTIAEQQAIVRAVKEAGIIWQTGSWQRSVSNFHKACEIVRNGLIGEVSHVEVGLPSGHKDFAKTGDQREVVPVPEELDYEMWTGPAEMLPYIPCRIHRNWRWHYNYGGGQLNDWIGHHCDIAHWGLGFDETGPVEIEGKGELPPHDAVWNTATTYRVETKYAQGVKMTIASAGGEIKMGTKWTGSEGWVWVDRGGFDCSNEAWKQKGKLPDELRKVKLYDSPGHYRNFLDCVKSRQPTITPAETAHHSAIPGHLGLISILTGKKLRWDPVKEEILEDAEASKLLTREYRGPWKLS